jgi:hypothetical protein
VVEGLFDLRGQGKATMSGAEEVKSLIQRMGGKLAADVDYRADYLVVGDEPSKPPKPKDDADPTANAVYQEQLKVWDRFQAALKAAKDDKIPVLNANRFLELVGQSLPPKGK